MAANYEMSFQDYLRVILKRKWIIALSIFTIFLSAVVYTNQISPIYRTSSRVELQYQSTLANLLADALLYKGNELASAVEFSTSLSVMERAVRDMGIVGPDSTTAEVVSAAQVLQGRASAAGDGTTNFITISVTDDDPVRAAASANAIAKAFVRQYSMRSSEESLETQRFIEQQLRDTERKLYQAEIDLLELQRQKDYVELAPGTRISLERAVEMEAEYERARAELRQVESELEAFRAAMDGAKSPEEATAVLSNSPKIKGLREELYQAELNHARLLQELTPRHPQVIEAQRELVRVRRQIELTISEVLNDREAGLEAQKASLSARTAALARAIPQAQALLDMVPRRQLEQARLQRVIALQERLHSFFRDKLEQKRYEDLVARENSLNFVEPARVPGSPIYPNKKNNWMIGFAFGLMLGLALAFIVEAMDTSIGTIEDVERTTGLPVLGVIPFIGTEIAEVESGDKSVVVFEPDRVRARDIKERLRELDETMVRDEKGQGRYSPELITFYDPKSPISEAYRTLRTNVLFKGLTGTAKTLTVTSSGPQEGKTTTLCNLAVAMAQSNQKVLAIGCNLRRPALHKILGINKKPGVSNVLYGEMDWRDVVQETGIPNLHAFCSGPIPPTPSELLGSDAMTKLIQEVREEYDVVIFDCPPILPVTDAALLSSKCDAVLLVYHVGKAGREALMRSKIQLENVNARILGIALNRISAEGRLGYSYYYYHYHYYGESSAGELDRGLKRRKS